MKKEAWLARTTDILYWLFRNKISLARQIQALFFKSYGRARNYMRVLQHKGLVTNYQLPYLATEKVYYLTRTGLKYLISQGKEDVVYEWYNHKKRKLVREPLKYKVMVREIPHDIVVIDILQWFIAKYDVNYLTDFELTRKMYKKGTTKHRIPDFAFEYKGIEALVEWQVAVKAPATIRKMLNDYKKHYKKYRIYFVVPDKGVKKYKKIFQKSNLDYRICTFSLKDGLKVQS